jgi:diaminopimelate epimerase
MLIYKYSASGNDFILTYHFKEGDRSQLARKLCDRFNGVGADGFIVLLPSDKYDFKWEFYNSDGSVAEMCGNGSRAAAHFAVMLGLAPARLTFETLAGPIEAEVKGNWVKTQLTPHRQEWVDRDEGGRKWGLYNTGVPHLVTIADSVERFDLEEARRLREKYDANVNWGAVERGEEGTVLRVRTFERGVEGETLACGTGMCATFLEAQRLGLVGDRVVVIPKSGERLEISLENGRLHFAGRVSPLFFTWINGKEWTK